ncbi:hypothetical protein Vretimale_9191 [Volvox reticuliferus]|uniref:Disease resistance R13L4/SHOC-2-like LRR domain-containing protein n=1 Tax=Volvox reticuliferus TaxID=1737510 RepID=A0A8J4CGN6_9CHLO|nr:hypothetical protein Vretifemale_9982 [Volvox reticuliferus]GIM04694.1 hypothetical protein Vretimale_9191 [Volvox reticuliferus]
MGGLCSREDRDTFDDVKPGNHTGSKQSANNHVASGGQPTHAEATVPASELIALKAQLQQLQERNSALLSAAKDSEGRYAELQSKLQELQKEHDGLQREFETTRQQLVGSGLRAQLEARADAERKLAEVQRQYTELKNMNNQLRRRVSDLATGHAEPPVAAPPAEQPISASEEHNRGVLAKIRDSNPGSKISVAFWRSSDFKRWQGVRTINGEVTGLALSGMQLTMLPTEVGQLTGLTALLLSNNSLTQLPSTLGQLTCLTSLLLDGNNLKQLPTELCDLTQLQTLWLHDNQLSCLPHALGKLTNLRQLIANDNALEQLPQSIGELKGLTSLWLDNNKLTELPETFSQLTELKRLRVDSVLLKLVPEQFRGNGSMVHASSRPAASTSLGLDAVSSRNMDDGAPAGSGSAPAQHPEQEPAESHSAAEVLRLQSDGEGRQAQVLKRTEDMAEATSAAHGGVVREGSGPALRLKGHKEALLAVTSLPGTGTSKGHSADLEQGEPADGEVVAQHASAT